MSQVPSDWIWRFTSPKTVLSGSDEGLALLPQLPMHSVWLLAGTPPVEVWTDPLGKIVGLGGMPRLDAPLGASCVISSAGSAVPPTIGSMTYVVAGARPLSVMLCTVLDTVADVLPAATSRSSSAGVVKLPLLCGQNWTDAVVSESVVKTTENPTLVSLIETRLVAVSWPTPSVPDASARPAGP